MNILWIILAVIAVVVTFINLTKSDKKSKERNDQVTREKTEKTAKVSKWMEQNDLKPEITLVAEDAVVAAEKGSFVYYSDGKDPISFQKIPLEKVQNVHSYNRWDGELIRLWLSASQYEAGVKPMINKKNYDNFSKRIGEPLYGIKLAMKDGNVIDIPCYYLKMEGLQYKKDESEQTVRFAEQLMSMLH